MAEVKPLVVPSGEYVHAHRQADGGYGDAGESIRPHTRTGANRYPVVELTNEPSPDAFTAKRVPAHQSEEVTMREIKEARIHLRVRQLEDFVAERAFERRYQGVHDLV